jgi:hypothetical protein
VCSDSFYYNKDEDTCDDCSKGGQTHALITSSEGIALIILMSIILILCVFMVYERFNSSRAKDEAYAQEVTAATVKWRAGWKHMETILKVLTAFVQIVVNISLVCFITFPSKFEVMLTAFSILNLDVLPALGIQCWFNGFNYIDSMIYMTASPLMLAVLIFVLYLSPSMWAKWRGNRTEEEQPARKTFYFFAFLLLTFCVLVGSSRGVLSFFMVCVVLILTVEYFMMITFSIFEFLPIA